MKILLTGGTGFIGTELTRRLLANGHTVTSLTRRATSQESNHPRLRYVSWDGKTSGAWEAELNETNVVINLAGEVIAGKRWSVQQKKKILDSRIQATGALVTAMARATTRPSVFISASAVGYYGNVSHGDVTESYPKGEGFLSDVCARWEQSALRASALNIRVVLPRIGVVLEQSGGALPKLLIPFKLGIGGWMGSGNQRFPWIHRDDIINALLFMIEQPDLHGPVNLTAPDPVTLKSFCKTLGAVLHRPAWAPVPAFMLKLMLGEMATTLLTGQKAVPSQLLEHGFHFQHPELNRALTSILTSKS